MEYKRPFDNQPIRYRYFYCSSLDDEIWRCVQCENEHSCHSFIVGDKSKFVKVSDDIPEYFDKIIVMSKVGTTKIEMIK